MKLTTRHDIEAPLDFVFGRLTDFDQFERMAMRRGAEVERTDKLRTPGPGASWRVRFTLRGKQRRMLIRLLEAEPGSHVVYGFDSPSVEGSTRLELLALSPRRTRMAMATEIRPKTLAARLVLQSMKLARGRIQRRFDQTGGKLANLVEERFRGAARA
jgi:uncharacterized protein YndB with AHSA1/START domain